MTDAAVDFAQERTCAVTGFSIVRPPTRAFRIAKHVHGAISPILRDSSPNRLRWGRWDSCEGRTVYAAETAYAAFAELIPYVKENLPGTALSELFPEDELSPDDASLTLAAAVRAEMPCPMLRDKIVHGWRDDRRLYELALPTDQWLIDIAASDSLAALNASLRAGAEDAGTDLPPPLTMADLAGKNRVLTTTIATWIRGLTLDDGSRPLGIQYRSKHGLELVAYALWLRNTDDGKPGLEAIKLITTSAITSSNSDLIRAAKIHGMTVIP